MITFYEKITMIDYLPTGNFYSYRMQKISEPDQFYDGYKNIEQRVTTLRQHKIEVKDSLFNPFAFTSQKHNYIQNSGTEKIETGRLYYWHTFQIDNNIHVLKRIHYNFWMALGDIGGFYYGLKMLLMFFMAPISAVLFENELLRGSIFAQDLTGRQKIQRNLLAQQIEKHPPEEPILEEDSNI